MSSNQLGLAAARPSSLPLAAVSATAPSELPASQPSASFGELGLTPELLGNVAAQGYTEPTPVQSQSIPIVLAGRDLLAGAQTGTGKTAAFVLPILQLLNASRPAVRYVPAGKARRRGETGLPIRCLILTPTRELALQIEENVRAYGGARPTESTTIYGGVGFNPQVRALRNGPEIVVATPGRLLDHAGQGTIDLSNVEILVLDEADRMLDMGFIRDIRRIIELLPENRQNLMFSATFSNDIKELAGGILRDPAFVQVARPNAPIELVRQVVYPVDRERKRELLSHLIKEGRIDRALVFTRTKHGANRLAEQLCDDGIRATAIHGNKSQGQRVRALDDFKAGRASILVATEVASRGIDIDGLPHVVNFELPMVAQDYVHRIGRTGRAGLEGDAVSLVCIDENMLMADIESLLRTRITREVVAGFEVNRAIPREPLRQRSGDVRPAAGRRAPARHASPPAAHRAAPLAPRPAASAPRETMPAAARAAAPRDQRQAVSGGHRQSVSPEGYRRPIPNDFRQSAQGDQRQASSGGFNVSAPVEPRRQNSSAPSFGYAPARRPGGGTGFSSGHGSQNRPAQGAAGGGKSPSGANRSGEWRGPRNSGPAARPLDKSPRTGR